MLSGQQKYRFADGIPNESDGTRNAGDRSRLVKWAAGSLLTAIILATYWSALAELVQRWYGDPDYVHGFLVPVFAAWLLWYRREMLQSALTPSPSPSRRGEYGSLWGLLLIAVAGAMRMVSSYYYYDAARSGLPDSLSCRACDFCGRLESYSLGLAQPSCS